jgi:hypothetical protein
MPQPMSEQYAPPSVTIRRYRASDVCDVVVVVRGQKMVLRCPDYPLALKCARLECRSYNVPRITGQRAIGRTAVILALSGAPFLVKILCRYDNRSIVPQAEQNVRTSRCQSTLNNLAVPGLDRVSHLQNNF